MPDPCSMLLLVSATNGTYIQQWRNYHLLFDELFNNSIFSISIIKNGYTGF
jgi:hypothetical protein